MDEQVCRHSPSPGTGAGPLGLRETREEAPPTCASPASVLSHLVFTLRTFLCPSVHMVLIDLVHRVTLGRQGVILLHRVVAIVTSIIV